MANEFLTEKLLGEELKKIFPDKIFIHDAQVPNSGLQTRPDYRCEELKLIVEYDGQHHYQKASNIWREKIKDDIYSKMGYNVIHVPYYIQLSKEVIKALFNIETEYLQTFPHGFISTEYLPADFCELGIRKFKDDLVRFHYIKKDIVQSLINKSKEFKNKETVVPSELEYLLSEII